MFLKQGTACYRVDDDWIRVGPGACAHTTWHMHNSPDAPEYFRMLLTYLTPVDQKLGLDAGSGQEGAAAAHTA